MYESCARSICYPIEHITNHILPKPRAPVVPVVPVPTVIVLSLSGYSHILIVDPSYLMSVQDLAVP